MQFSVTKASGRLRPGQTVECDAGATLDGGPLVGRMLTGVPGPLKYYARFLPVARVHAEGVVRALSVLGHPNVIGPIGVGGVDGDVFIVQEMPEGESLDRWIQRGRATGERMKLREVEQVLRHAATALRHAHQAQIRHGAVSAGHQGKANYRKRKWIAEPPNAWIKNVLGFRQFSMRGLRKAQAEFKLVCLALNLRRMGAMQMA